MKYCYNCNHVTTGEPLYCNFCGRSYNVKLCPRGHANPRSAEVCSQCGSREMSTPQPKIPFLTRLLALCVFLLIGSVVLLVALSFIAAFLHELFTNTNVPTALVAIGILLSLLWWMWEMVPLWFRKLLARLLRSGGRKQ